MKRRSNPNRLCEHGNSTEVSSLGQDVKNQTKYAKTNSYQNTPSEHSYSGGIIKKGYVQNNQRLVETVCMNRTMAETRSETQKQRPTKVQHRPNDDAETRERDRNQISRGEASPFGRSS